MRDKESGERPRRFGVPAPAPAAHPETRPATARRGRRHGAAPGAFAGSDMAVRRTGTGWAYHCRRYWPGRAHCHMGVRVGEPLSAAEVGPLDQFLTARYHLYSRVAGRFVAADAEHPPWPLHRAEVTGVDQDLVAAAGLPAPDGDPLVHASPGVRVRIGMWRPL